MSEMLKKLTVLLKYSIAVVVALKGSKVAIPKIIMLMNTNPPLSGTS